MKSHNESSPHQLDEISIEINDHAQTEDLPLYTSQVVPKNAMQLAKESLYNFVHDNIFPYTTFAWLNTYIMYTGLFWGFVFLLWHFDNNLHENMDNGFTDPQDWYISSAFSAWSSMAYMTPVPFVPIEMKIPLISLAVSSFCLWSDPGDACRLIDITSIHWVIFSVMIQKTTSPYRHNTGHIVNIVFAIFFGYFIGKGLYTPMLEFYTKYMTYSVGVVTAINVCMTFNTFGFRRNIVIGVCACMLGFWSKFQDINHGHDWGTGLFHILTAIGVAIVLLPTKPIKHSDGSR